MLRLTRRAHLSLVLALRELLPWIKLTRVSRGLIHETLTRGLLEGRLELACRFLLLSRQPLVLDLGLSVLRRRTIKQAGETPASRCAAATIFLLRADLRNICRRGSEAKPRTGCVASLPVMVGQGAGHDRLCASQGRVTALNRRGHRLGRARLGNLFLLVRWATEELPGKCRQSLLGGVLAVQASLTIVSIAHRRSARERWQRRTGASQRGAEE